MNVQQDTNTNPQQDESLLTPQYKALIKESLQLNHGFTFEKLENSEQKREEQILQFMDKAPQNLKNSEHLPLMAYLNHFSYIYARISRAMLYNYANIKYIDFTISLNSFFEFQNNINQISCIVFYLLQMRLNYFKENKEIFKDFEIYSKILDIYNLMKQYLDSQNLDEILPEYMLLPDQNIQEEQEELMKQQNYDKKGRKFKLELDIQHILYLTDILITSKNQNIPLKIVGEAKKINLMHIKPFIGYIGKKQNLIISYFRQKNTAKYEQTSKNNDFRGIICEGSKQVFIIWHGSCSEYDWHANLDTMLTHPREDLLPNLNKNWQVQRGFSELMHLSLNANQYENIITNQSNDDNNKQQQQNQNNLTLEQIFLKLALQEHKQIIFSGHSQGAALAYLAFICTYQAKQKYYNKQQAQNHNMHQSNGTSRSQKRELNISSWVFSMPRVFSNNTCNEINNLFNISQLNENSPLIRQNVQGDPVTMAFQDIQEAYERIRRVFFLSQIILQRQFTQIFQKLFKSEKFLQSLKKMQQSHQFDIQGVIQGHFVENEFIKPLYSEKYQGDISKFIIDYSQSSSIIHKQLWEQVAKHYWSEIIQSLPKSVQKQLDLKQKDINGDYLKQKINTIGKLLSLDDEHQQENVEILIFQSPHSYKLSLNQVQNNDLLTKQKEIIKKQQLDSNKEKFTLNGLISDIKTKIKAAQPSEQQEINLENLDLINTSYSKNFLQILLNHSLQKQYFLRELSCFGDILEGLLHFCADYGDCGVLLLDHLDFHIQSQRLYKFDILQNFFGSKKDNIDLEGLDYKQGFETTKKQILQYVSPYHYGKQDLDGSFDPELVKDSQIPRMHAYAQFFIQQNSEDKIKEIYRLGLLKQHLKSVFKNKDKEEGPKLQILKRIQSQVDIFPIFYEELQQQYEEKEKENEKDNKQYIQQGQKLTNIFSVFDNLEEKDLQKLQNQYLQYKNEQNEIQNHNSGQENKNQIKFLNHCSYFLSSILKSLQVMHNKLDQISNYGLESFCREIYINFINTLLAIEVKDNNQAILIYLKEHTIYLNIFQGFVRNNNFEKN